jgi:hypothetical protein
MSLKTRIFLCLCAQVVDMLSKLKANFFDLQDGLAKFIKGLLANLNLFYLSFIKLSVVYYGVNSCCSLEIYLELFIGCLALHFQSLEPLEVVVEVSALDKGLNFNSHCALYLFVDHGADFLA